MKKAYMVIGCPGAGKSWVCDQLKEKFTYVHHDLYIGMAGGTYVNAIKEAAKTAEKPLLIEAPFSITQIMDPLKAEGFDIEPVFIQEEPEVISERYRNRESKEIPKGHLTRQNTYLERANAWNAFHGTSSQVLEHLTAKAEGKPPAEGEVRSEGQRLMTLPEATNPFSKDFDEVQAKIQETYGQLNEGGEDAA